MLAATLLSSCASYVTPARPANMTTFTDHRVKKAFVPRPANRSPAPAVVVKANELDPGLFHFSSTLATGKPMAIINRRAYYEGENIRIPKSVNLPANVRVMRIFPDKVILNCKDSTIEVPLSLPK